MPKGLDRSHANGMSGHVQQKVSRFLVSMGRWVKWTMVTKVQMMTDATMKCKPRFWPRAQACLMPCKDCLSIAFTIYRESKGNAFMAKWRNKGHNNHYCTDNLAQTDDYNGSYSQWQFEWVVR
jgi:hypothetical protein